MNAFITDILTRCIDLLIFLPFVVYALLRTATKDKYYLLLPVAALFLLDQLCYELPVSGFLSTFYWPWQGKFLSLAWILLFIYFSRIPAREFGLTVKLAPGSAGIAWLFVFAWPAVMFIQAYYSLPKEKVGTETFLYQLTMPGLTEELVFRGIFLALLNRLFPKKWLILQTEVGWGWLLVTILFALAHAITLNDHSIIFQPQTFILVFAGGFILGILREKTGSLLPSVLCHNFWNTAIYLARAL